MEDLVLNAERAARLAMTVDDLEREKSIRSELKRILRTKIETSQQRGAGNESRQEPESRDDGSEDIITDDDEPVSRAPSSSSNILRREGPSHGKTLKNATDGPPSTRAESLLYNSPSNRTKLGNSPDSPSERPSQSSSMSVNQSPSSRSLPKSPSTSKATHRTSSSDGAAPASKRQKTVAPKALMFRKPSTWQGGSVFVVPRGQDVTLMIKKAWEAKVQALGGVVVHKSEEADILVVSSGVKRDVVEREYLRKRSENKLQIWASTEWLRHVLVKEAWVDPMSESRFQHSESSPPIGLVPIQSLSSILPMRVQHSPPEETEEAITSEREKDDEDWVNNLPSKYRKAAQAMNSLQRSSTDSPRAKVEPFASQNVLDEFSTNKWTKSGSSSSASAPVTLADAARSVVWLDDPQGSLVAKQPIDALLGLHGGQIYLKPRRPIPKESLACQKLPQAVSKEKSEALNSKLIQELGKMADLMDAKGDKWRAKSYSQAVAIIRSLDFEVKNSGQIRHRKGIGKNMCDHIDEILSTGKMEKRVNFESDPVNQALINMKNIYGVGEEWAARLVKLGFTDIASVRAAVAAQDKRLNLSRAQQIGIKRYEDLLLRMPRAEMESILNYVKQAAQHVYGIETCSELVIEIAGSYRRGKDTSGDIDIIMTSPTRLKERLAITPLIRFLQKEGLITDVLTLSVDARHNSRDASLDLEDPSASSRSTLDESAHLAKLMKSGFFAKPSNEYEPESETFMGVCKLPSTFPQASGLHRRIDIKSYPAETFAFALLYFTGSAHFNRSMRYYAKQLGFTLSDKGLYPCTRLSKDKKLKGDSILCRTEQDIFEALGLEYRAPKDRNCDEITIVSGKNAVQLAEGEEALEVDEGERDDDLEGVKELSDDDEVDSNRLPSYFCHEQETLEHFLKRLSPSSYAVKAPHIRIWAPHCGTASFDVLDKSNALAALKAEYSSPGNIKLPEVICDEFGCLTGKWLVMVKREDVDALWAKVCSFVIDETRNVGFLMGAKVNSIAFRRRKIHLSTMSLYNADFRDRSTIGELLKFLRVECGVGGALIYKSEAMTALTGDPLYTSKEGLTIGPFVRD